jgi:hypothetical protein
MRVGEGAARLDPKGDELALVPPGRKAELVHVVRGRSLLVAVAQSRVPLPCPPGEQGGGRRGRGGGVAVSRPPRRSGGYAA